jgi:hypothetical protein
MSEPYLLIAYWENAAPDYDFLARAMATAIDAVDATMTVQWLTGGHQTFITGTATDSLASTVAAVSGFAIDLMGGASVATSSWGRSGRVIEMDLRGSDPLTDQAGDDKGKVYANIRALVAPLIEQGGAAFVWATRVQGDVDGVSELIEAFDAALSSDSTSPPLSLDQMSHAGWLFAWSSAPNRRAIQTTEKIEYVGDVKFVELVDDRPIDLTAGWITPATLGS